MTVLVSAATGRAQARDAGGARGVRAAARADGLAGPALGPGGRWLAVAPLARRRSDEGTGTQELRGASGRLRGPDGLDLGPIWVQAAAGMPLARRACLDVLASAAGGVR
jgi:hypothetical protein